jgi:hypothetical protein
MVPRSPHHADAKTDLGNYQGQTTEERKWNSIIPKFPRHIFLKLKYKNLGLPNIFKIL